MVSPTDSDIGPNIVHWNTNSPAAPPEAKGDETTAKDDVPASSDATANAEPRSSQDTTPTLAESNKTKSDSETPEILENVKSMVGSMRKKFHLHSISATGPSKRFNPTSVSMHVKFQRNSKDDQKSNESDPSKELSILWRSRDNRKGRGSIAVPNSAYPIPHPSRPMTFNLKVFFKGVRRMCTTLPYWDMAWWSGFSYSIGSVLFVMDGAFAWGPLAFPSTEWPGEAKYAVPLLFFIGALFYQVGATVAYLEAVNDGSFAGSTLRRFLEGHEDTKKEMLDEKIHSFFDHFVPHRGRHRDEEEAEKRQANVDPEAGWRTKDIRARPGSIYPGMMRPAPRRGGVDLGEAEEGESSEYLTWRWWPTWDRLRTHHIYEIGYIACTIQLFGATLYGMCGVVSLPGIMDTLSEWQTNAAYWIPQIIASVCFLSAGLLFTFETQEKWYKPKYRDLGWWIGFWACIGSMGFLLCGSLGPASFSNTGAAYQSSLSSMWGSAGYLLSSLCQWYEAVNKHENVDLSDEDDTAS